MLTDSGVNAMSDQQLASMMIADDAYAGSATYYKLEDKVTSLFGLPFFLPAHQGRACEHIIAKTLVKPGMRVPMNYHFTTTKSHIVLQGGEVDELVIDEGLKLQSTHPFKGNMDLEKLRKYFSQYPKEKCLFKNGAGTNLIGGQPFRWPTSGSNPCAKTQSLCSMQAVTGQFVFHQKREEAETRNHQRINERNLPFLILFTSRLANSGLPKAEDLP